MQPFHRGRCTVASDGFRRYRLVDTGGFCFRNLHDFLVRAGPAKGVLVYGMHPSPNLTSEYYTSLTSLDTDTWDPNNFNSAQPKIPRSAMAHLPCSLLCRDWPFWLRPARARHQPLWVRANDEAIRYTLLSSRRGVVCSWSAGLWSTSIQVMPSCSLLTADRRDSQSA